MSTSKAPRYALIVSLLLVGLPFAPTAFAGPLEDQGDPADACPEDSAIPLVNATPLCGDAVPDNQTAFEEVFVNNNGETHCAGDGESTLACTLYDQDPAVGDAIDKVHECSGDDDSPFGSGCVLVTSELAEDSDTVTVTLTGAQANASALEAAPSLMSFNSIGQGTNHSANAWCGIRLAPLDGNNAAMSVSVDENGDVEYTYSLAFCETDRAEFEVGGTTDYYVSVSNNADTTYVNGYNPAGAPWNAAGSVPSLLDPCAPGQDPVSPDPGDPANGQLPSAEACQPEPGNIDEYAGGANDYCAQAPGNETLICTEVHEAVNGTIGSPVDFVLGQQADADRTNTYCAAEGAGTQLCVAKDATDGTPPFDMNSDPDERTYCVGAPDVLSVCHGWGENEHRGKTDLEWLLDNVLGVNPIGYDGYWIEVTLPGADVPDYPVPDDTLPPEVPVDPADSWPDELPGDLPLGETVEQGI